LILLETVECREKEHVVELFDKCEGLLLRVNVTFKSKNVAISTRLHAEKLRQQFSEPPRNTRRSYQNLLLVLIGTACEHTHFISTCLSGSVAEPIGSTGTADSQSA
jgi:hypothetical protein